MKHRLGSYKKEWIRKGNRR